MTVKEINITFLVETDDVLATINAIDEEVRETWPLESEDEASLAYVQGFQNTYTISYQIKIKDNHESADNTESETEASDSHPDVLQPLPLEF